MQWIPNIHTPQSCPCTNGRISHKRKREPVVSAWLSPDLGQRAERNGWRDVQWVKKAEVEEVFLSLHMSHYQTVKKKGWFYAAGTLGCLKSGRVDDLLPQKAAEGQQDSARFIMRFDISTDKFMCKACIWITTICGIGVNSYADSKGIYNQTLEG